MTDPTAPPNPLAVWDRLAGWWDAALGDDGNAFQRLLVYPATERLLRLRPDERVLDAACGNGTFSRRLARAGAQVVAFDGSASIIDLARRRGGVGRIAYHVCDGTDEAAVLRLAGPGSFSAVVCNMALMDLPVITPLLRAVRRLLTDDGRFVFSVPHPCFNSPDVRMTAELEQSAGRPGQVFGVSLWNYLEPRVELSPGLVNQPEPHPVYHRPLHHLLGDCFAAGFAVDGLEEPAFPPEMAAKNPFSWAKRPLIPPAVVVRLRPL